MQKFYASLAEDWVNSYELDGVMFGCERQGPLNNTIMAYGVGGAGHNAPTCFCAYCVEKARGWGLDPVRARAGFVALDEWVRSVRANGRPTDGYFVTFWRLLLEYPELLAWEKLWTDNLWSYYRLVYGELKAIRPGLRVGLHIWHNNSFSPFYRAEVDYSKYAECADFLKIVAYNNSGGPRMAAYVRNLHSTVLGDITPEPRTCEQWGRLAQRLGVRLGRGAAGRALDLGRDPRRRRQERPHRVAVASQLGAL